MSASAFRDWQRYLNYGTVTERLLDRHLSTLCALIANQWRKKGSKPYMPKEFRLLAQKPVYRSPTYMRDKMIAMTLAAGGNIIDKRAS